MAPTPSTVLLQGETGVGKELVAHAIHDRARAGPGRSSSSTARRCPRSLVESELFGHEKAPSPAPTRSAGGASSSPTAARSSSTRSASCRSSCRPSSCACIQDGEFERVGGTATLKADVRLIAATNRDLDDEVKAGRFREDL